MGRKHTGLCSCLRGLAAQMTDSFDPDYRIKFLGEIGRAAKLDLQGKLGGTRYFGWLVMSTLNNPAMSLFQSLLSV